MSDLKYYPINGPQGVFSLGPTAGTESIQELTDYL